VASRAPLLRDHCCQLGPGEAFRVANVLDGAAFMNRILICCAVLIVLAPGITSGHGYLDGRGGPVHARNRCRRRHRALRSLQEIFTFPVSSRALRRSRRRCCLKRIKPVPATPQQLDTCSNTNHATERGESAAALQYELANSSVLTTIALRSVADRRIIRPGRYDGSQSGQGRP
jgi:hypothetical protein